MNSWSEANVEELNRSLEAAMSPQPTDIDRYGMGSPDSGIHVSSGLEYDFNDALLGVDDPIFSDISAMPSGTAVEVIPAEHPVIISDFTAVNESYDDAVEEMEEMEEEEEEDSGSNYSEEENEENTSSNIPKNHPVEIHSYSVIKLKREQTFKAKSSHRSAVTRTKQPSGGRKYKVSISQKKQKLYEMEPLNDPVAEKNRLNALNAKKNRDRKKQQLAEAEMEKIGRAHV